MKKIQSIQGFRALGFVCVFLWHCGYGNAGAFAVSLFIMLSGYLLMLNNSWGGGERNFLKNIANALFRISRLYPLHFIMFIAAFIFLFLTNQMDYYHIGLKGLSNLLLLQSCIPLSDYYYSFNGVSWYLSLTLFLSMPFS